MGKAQHTVAMEQISNYDFGLNDAILKKPTDNDIESNKCNQCDYSSSHRDNLRKHLKMHSGEKSNKCNQCDYASFWAGDLRKHLKTHGGEKSNKCNQCDYASSRAGDLTKHLKTHSGEK